MEKITYAQSNALNEVSTIFSNECSKEKGAFPKDKRFSFIDKLNLIKHFRVIVPTLSSVIKTPKIIKNQTKHSITKETISEKDFKELDNLIKNTLEIDSWGVAEMDSIDVLDGYGIPYKNIIVLSKNMDKEEFNPSNLPNMNCQIEVMKVYGETGIAAIKVTNLLRKLGYAAYPNHSLGGNVDYTKAGMLANLGFIGKHGMLITKENGSCNRISIVYTNIPNLNSFLSNNEDYNWGYDFCKSCKNCVKKCPHDAIYEENVVDEFGHVESINVKKCHSGFKNYGCAICIGVCPFTKIDYNRIKESYYKRKV